jgi:hypothetical protein
LEVAVVPMYLLVNKTEGHPLHPTWIAIIAEKLTCYDEEYAFILLLLFVVVVIFVSNEVMP